MAIYELEERILFDGAMPADIADVQEDLSAVEAEAAANAADNGDSQNSAKESVSISPETDAQIPNSEGADFSSEKTEDSDVSEYGDDTNPDFTADKGSFGKPGAADEIEAILEGLDDIVPPDGFNPEPNILLISSENENYDRIAESVNDDTILIEYDPDNSFDTAIQKLKEELSDRQAANIGIVQGPQQSVLSDVSALSDDFLNELSSLCSFDGELNIISAENDPAGGPTGFTAFTLSTEPDGDWISVEDGDADSLSDYFDADSSILTQLSEIVNTHELYFIDHNIDDIDKILDEIPDDAVVIELAENEGVDRITEIINEHSDIDGVHIISQANYAQIMLGDDVITDENIGEFQEAFSSWSDNLSENADILFYGCDIAKETQGQSVINQIAEWTGADIAASTDITGSNVVLNGDHSLPSTNNQQPTTNWDLEYSTGAIEAAAISVNSYAHHLETYTVTQTSDDGSGNIEGSLSWAVEQANANTGADEIIFSESLNGQTILLGDSITVEDDLIITGNDEGNITVENVNSDTVFVIDDGVNDNFINVSVDNITVNGSIDNHENFSLNGSGYQLAFIDIEVRDKQVIIDRFESLGIQCITVDNSESGVKQIADYLDNRSGIDGIHIISEGNYSQLGLGDDLISPSNVEDYQINFSEWQNALSEDADILFYACSIAEDEAGQGMLRKIADYTEADISASVNDTGSIGDWDLEFTIGNTQIDAVSVNEYNGKLGTTVWVDNGGSGDNSLYDAIQKVNDDYFNTDVTIIIKNSFTNTTTLSPINSDAHIIIRSETGEKNTITQGDDSDLFKIREEWPDPVCERFSIQDLILNGNDKNYSAIDVRSVANFEFTDSTITNWGSGGTGTDHGYGIVSSNEYSTQDDFKITIENSTFSYIYASGPDPDDYGSALRVEDSRELV